MRRLSVNHQPWRDGIDTLIAALGEAGNLRRSERRQNCWIARNGPMIYSGIAAAITSGRVKRRLRK
ncbi:hypothetical protein [Rhodoblastus sp.]|uniref:hypothetical protein n=1 Tax=Rhodoblastus sp. TaxID=1962975 RepID=UPI002609C110|nr:hypothetical protein [Rhodoblastus sp.]